VTSAVGGRRSGEGESLDQPFSLPGPGRTYAMSHRVRLGDVSPNGRVRLDAVVRYLQDVAADDVRDAGIEGDVVWVVRRTVVAARHRPRYNQPIELLTWCSGSGPAWAERRTTLSVDGRAAVEAVSLWVSLDPATLRPMELPGHFFDIYGLGARQRSVKSRLVHPRPPVAAAASGAPATAGGASGSAAGVVSARPGVVAIAGLADGGPAISIRDWPLRRADFDVLGHVNNAVSWAAVEEELDRLEPGVPIEVGELEYRAAVDPGTRLRLISQLSGGVGALWLVNDADIPLVSARVRVGPAAGMGRGRG